MITGFDSFGKFTFNPSQRIAESLPEEFKIPRTNVLVEVDTLVLPTCCKKSWRAIRNQLSKNQYKFLIMIGLASGRSRISLERYALNIRDYGIPDNDGHRYDGTPIYKGESEALKTNLSLTDLRRVLRGKNFPTEVSNFAGSFICNEVYYHALRYKEETGALNSVLFVHVPEPKDLARTMVEAKHIEMESVKSAAARSTKALQLMTNCVQEIATYCTKLS